MARGVLGLFTSFTYWDVAWFTLFLSLLLLRPSIFPYLDLTVLSILDLESWLFNKKQR